MGGSVCGICGMVCSDDAPSVAPAFAGSGAGVAVDLDDQEDLIGVVAGVGKGGQDRGRGDLFEG